MKSYLKILFLLVALVLSSQVINAQEVFFGKVRTDGFQKIIKGAMWSKRQEAKMVYEGSVPPGCKVYTLESDYFIRFVDEEHNALDCNYIVFPKGEKIYTFEGCYYAAICGNKLEFIKPVDSVRIVEKNENENQNNQTVQNQSTQPTVIVIQAGGQERQIVCQPQYSDYQYCDYGYTYNDDQYCYGYDWNGRNCGKMSLSGAYDYGYNRVMEKFFYSYSNNSRYRSSGNQCYGNNSYSGSCGGGYNSTAVFAPQLNLSFSNNRSTSNVSNNIDNSNHYSNYGGRRQGSGYNNHGTSSGGRTRGTMSGGRSSSSSSSNGRSSYNGGGSSMRNNFNRSYQQNGGSYRSGNSSSYRGNSGGRAN